MYLINARIITIKIIQELSDTYRVNKNCFYSLKTFRYEEWRFRMENNWTFYGNKEWCIMHMVILVLWKSVLSHPTIQVGAIVKENVNFWFYHWRIKLITYQGPLLSQVSKFPKNISNQNIPGTNKEIWDINEWALLPTLFIHYLEYLWNDKPQTA